MKTLKLKCNVWVQGEPLTEAQDRLHSEQDITLEQYIEGYIEEERLRGNEIDMFTIQNATEAYEGGAR